MGGVTIPLPAALSLVRSTPFLGRDEVLQRLLDAYAAAGATRRAVLVAGEPGIGKSRLLAEAAQQLHARGAVVLFGRCDEETLVPYQPFVEALSHYAAHVPTDDLRKALGPDAGELTRLLPDLREELGPGEGERYRLYEAVNALLGSVSSGVPVVLVLEDMQWVDTAAGLLLRHLFRHPRRGSLLVLASYRDTEIEPGHPFSEVLAQLRLPEHGERLRLEGLGPEHVAGILGATLGSAGVPLADSLWAQTEGNPFFVEEVVRQLREKGDLDWARAGIPEGIRDVIGRRLLRLAPTTVRLLEQAAVIGRTFEAAVVEEAAGLTPDEVLLGVEEAVEAGLLRESASRPGRLAFTHDLVRQTLYDKLSLLRRARSHRAVGEALEHVGAEAPELAHHFLRGAQSGEVDKALEYTSGAAQQALGRLAYEEAAQLWERALEVVEDDASPLRAGPLMGLADARRRAGDANGSRQAYLQVVDLARWTHDHDLLGRAALGYGEGSGGLHRAVRRDDEHIALLEEALDRLGTADSALRVRLLARLAEELYFTQQSERRRGLAEEAVAMALRVGQKDVLLSARYARELIRVGPDTPLSDRLESTGDLVALAMELGQRETAYLGHLLRELTFFEAGDREAGKRELDSAGALADELRMPALQAWVLGARARRAWVAGDLVQADDLNAGAMSRAMELGGDPEVAQLVLGGQLLAHQILRSDLSAFVPPLEEFRDAYPHLPILRGFLAYAYAETGKLDLAQGELDALAAEDFHDVPRTVEWPGTLWACSRTAYLLDDRPRAERLYELALPMSGRWFADWASICVGPVDTVLGLLSLVRRDVPTAVEHLESAVAQAAALPSPPWTVDAQLHLATALEPTDPRRASLVRSRAREAAADIGLEALCLP